MAYTESLGILITWHGLKSGPDPSVGFWEAITLIRPGKSWKGTRRLMLPSEISRPKKPLNNYLLYQLTFVCPFKWKSWVCQ